MTTEDRLVELQERRSFLLRSLDDLERERAAGDLSAPDYELLHRDYTRRAAAVLRELEGATSAIASPKRSLVGTLLLAGGAVGVAIGAAVLVAAVAGERKGTDGLTGTVSAASANNNAARVEALMATGRSSLASDPAAAIKAFDEASDRDPTRAEAFAYAGWVLRIVAQSVDDPTQKRQLLDGAIRRLDRAIAVDPRYPDARAFRAITLLRDRNDAKAALSDFVALEGLNVPNELTQMITAARQDAEEAAAAP